jgi:hypothetical protein
MTTNHGAANPAITLGSQSPSLVTTVAEAGSLIIFRL